MPIPFNTSVRVDAGAAKQDLIKIEIGSWYVRFPDNNSLAEYLGGLNDNTLIPESIIAPSCGFFLLNQQTLERTYNFKIQPQGSSRTNADRPLFQGRLKSRSSNLNDFSRYGNLNQYEIARQFIFELEINPTRYVSHQTWVIPPILEELGDISLRTRERPRSTQNNALLTPSDNAMLSQRMYKFAGNGELWRGHLSRYWDGMIDSFESIIDRYPESSGRAFCNENINIRYIETYWEFRCSDALSLVRQLSEIALLYGADSTLSEYQSMRMEHNSLSLRIHVSGGIFIKVYPKGTTVIRFELEHDLTNSNTALMGGHTRDSFGGFFEIVDSCVDVAVTYMNDFLRFVESRYPSNTEQRSLYRLLSEIYKASDDEGQFELIISILSNCEGRIVLRHQNDEIRRVVNRLFKRGVLVRTRARSRVLIVDAKYESAMNRLVVDSI